MKRLLAESVHRLTNSNCCGRCSRPWATKNTSRAFALCGVFLRHILPALQMLRIRLFRLSKRQLLRTLGEIAEY